MALVTDGEAGSEHGIKKDGCEMPVWASAIYGIGATSVIDSMLTGKSPELTAFYSLDASSSLSPLRVSFR